MSRKRHLLPAQRTFVLDSEALSRMVEGDRRFRALIQAAPKLDIAVVTSAMTTLEAWNPRRRAPLWDWALTRVGVVHTDDALVATARQLMRDAGLHGHKYAIDALLAAVALGAPGMVTVFTSDADDLGKLLADSAVLVEPLS
jgi:hypothetical protein